jgi:hypothetical protein
MNLSLGFFSVGRQFWQQTHAMHLQLNGLEKLGNRKNNICPFIFFSYLYICSSHPAVQLCSQGSRKVKLFHVLSRARFSFFFCFPFFALTEIRILQQLGGKFTDAESILLFLSLKTCGEKCVGPEDMAGKCQTHIFCTLFICCRALEPHCCTAAGVLVCDSLQCFFWLALLLFFFGLLVASTQQCGRG